MKTIQYSILLALAIFTFSCSSDDDRPAALAPVHKNLLIKVTSGQSVTNYTYDSNNRLAKETYATPGLSSGEVTFVYNSAGKLEEEKSVSSSIFGSASTSKTVYVYNTDGTLKERRYFSLDDNTGSYDLDLIEKYTYEQNKAISVRESSGNTTRTVYEYDNGNTSKASYYFDVTVANPTGFLNGSTIYNAYDDKNNPHASMPAEFFFPQTIRNNNTSSYFSSNPETPTVIIYEYNEDGYPVKSVNGGSTITYEYQRL